MHRRPKGGHIFEFENAEVDRRVPKSRSEGWKQWRELRALHDWCRKNDLLESEVENIILWDSSVTNSTITCRSHFCSHCRKHSTTNLTKCRRGESASLWCCICPAMALSGVIVPSLQINSPISVSNSGNKHLRHLGNVSNSAFQLTQQSRLCLPRKVRLDSRVVRAMAGSGTAGSKVEEKLGVRIERDPSESRLTELGIRSWLKWGCPPSKFPWTYDATETCYLLQGKVKVYPEGSSEFVEFGAGDLVVFPKGMSCTWDVSETVDKHYQFDY